MDVEQVHDASAGGCENPASPEGPAEAAGEGDEDTDGDGGRGDGEGLREDGDASHDGGEVFDTFVVEREVVEHAPEDYPVGKGAEVVHYNPRLSVQVKGGREGEGTEVWYSPAAVRFIKTSNAIIGSLAP